MKKSHDIIIVGGGIVGATIALGLARETSLSIALLDAAPLSTNLNLDEYLTRVSAITLASRKLFQRLGVWQDIVAARVSPFQKINVFAENETLEFDSREIAEPVLGYIIENQVMQAMLLRQLSSLRAEASSSLRAQRSNPVDIISSIKLKALTESEELAELQTEDGRKFAAPLIVAADGKNSWLRQQKNISVTQKEYNQSAVVATIKTEKPHHKIARQWFVGDEIIAFLPLDDPHHVSLVWSMPSAASFSSLRAQRSNPFGLPRSSATADSLAMTAGDIEVVGKCYAFPLKQQQAENYFSSRVVLAGDAAHVMHPLAGQGVNTGLQDAKTLIDCLSCQRSALSSQRSALSSQRSALSSQRSALSSQRSALSSQRRLGSIQNNNWMPAYAGMTKNASAGMTKNASAGMTKNAYAGMTKNASTDLSLVDSELYSLLRKYERTCRANNQLMMFGVDFIKQVFSTKSYLPKKFCTLSMSLTKRAKHLRQFFIKHAAGIN